MTKPAYRDVDVAVVEGVIQLIGDGGLLIADLGGDNAGILYDMLGEALVERERQLQVAFANERVAIANNKAGALAAKLKLAEEHIADLEYALGLEERR